MEFKLGDRVHDVVRDLDVVVERIDFSRHMARCWWRDSRGERRSGDFWLDGLVSVAVTSER